MQSGIYKVSVKNTVLEQFQEGENSSGGREETSFVDEMLIKENVKLDLKSSL
jgi:hypothetical protein